LIKDNQTETEQYKNHYEWLREHVSLSDSIFSQLNLQKMLMQKNRNL
jgi:hypothetical protein